MGTNEKIQLAILIVSVVSVIGTIVLTQRSIKKSIDLTHKQFKIQVFLEYTKRYNEIILHMPKGPFFENSVEDPEMQKYMILYLNLYREEYHLQEKGMIDSEVWGMWKNKIRTTMKDPFYKRLYDKVIGEYNFKSWQIFRHDFIDYEKTVATTSDTKDEKKSRKCSLRAIINKIKNNIKLKK